MGGWNKTRNYHHTFGLSFLPLGPVLTIFFLQVTWARVDDGGAPASDNQRGWGLGQVCSQLDAGGTKVRVGMGRVWAEVRPGVGRVGRTGRPAA